MSTAWTPYDLRSTISSGRLAPSGKTINGLAPQETNPFIPALSPFHVMPYFGGDMLAMMPTEKYIYLFGPAGTGKTSTVKYLAALFRIPVYEVTGHSRLEFPELIGSYKLINQNMVWVDGPLTMALRQGGIFLLNEQSLLDPATAAGLNTILDGSSLLIPETNELVKPHAEFRYIATDNTNGNGDETGMYSGTLRQNAALMSRFAFVKADYLPRHVEQAILQKQVPNLPDEIVSKILDYTADVRRAYTMPDSEAPLSITMSPRDYIRWGRLCLTFENVKNQGVSPVKYALERAFLYRASTTDQVTLLELFQRIFGNEQTKPNQTKVNLNKEI